MVNLKGQLVKLGGLTIRRMNSVTIRRRKRAHVFVAGSVETYSTPEGKAHVAPVGEAPTYVNTQHFPPQAGLAAGSSAESSPRKDLFDMSGFPLPLVSLSFEVSFYMSFIGTLCND